jgi:hypothetical protein
VGYHTPVFGYEYLGGAEQNAGSPGEAVGISGSQDHWHIFAAQQAQGPNGGCGQNSIFIAQGAVDVHSQSAYGRRIALIFWVQLVRQGIASMDGFYGASAFGL